MAAVVLRLCLLSGAVTLLRWSFNGLAGIYYQVQLSLQQTCFALSLRVLPAGSLEPTILWSAGIPEYASAVRMGKHTEAHFRTIFMFLFFVFSRYWLKHIPEIPAIPAVSLKIIEINNKTAGIPVYFQRISIIFQNFAYIRTKPRAQNQ